MSSASTSSAWELLADRTLGDVASLAMARTADGLLLLAATAAGVYRSTNSGRRWSLAAAGANVPLAEALAVSERFAQDRTVYLCAGDGLYRSSDGATSWQLVLVGSRMLSVATASALQRGEVSGEMLVLAGTATDGILRSDNGGRTWTGANAGLLDLSVLALALSPRFGQDRTGFAATPSGLYRTRNGARSWREVDTGLTEPAVQCLALSPNFAVDQLILAGTEAEGLLLSGDAGATWHQPAALAERCVTALAFANGYPNPSTIAAATDAGVALSRDGGRTWVIPHAQPAEVLTLLWLPDSADDPPHDQHRPGVETLLAGLHRRGLSRSSDEAASWTPATSGLHANLLVAIALSPAFGEDGTAFAAGLQDGVTASRDGGTTWSESAGWPADVAALGLAVSPAFAQDQMVYGATPSGVLVSRDAGATWRAGSLPAAPVRAVVTPCAAAGPSGTVWAALAGGALAISEDAAVSWRPLAPEFSASAAADILALAISPTYDRDGALFVVTTTPDRPAVAGETVLWRSTDGGAHWQRWLVTRGPYASAALAVSPEHAVDELVFVGLGSRIFQPLHQAREVRGRERRPIWRRVDLCRDVLAISALRLSPAFGHDHTVFAATNAGVFVSRDGGQSFAAWSDGLGSLRIVALALSPGYREDRLVFALSLGGALWRRVDVA